MIFLDELCVEATLENLRIISHFIHGVGRRLRLTEEVLYSIDLAVEEAAANIVRHAYPADAVGKMLVRVEMLDIEVRITLTDWGIPLNPDDVKPFDINAPVETRIRGGLGLHLIRSLMDEVARKTASGPGGPNTFTLVKRIPLSP